MAESDTSKIDSMIDRYAADKELLTSIFQEIQTEYGYLPRDALIRVSERLAIPLGQIYGVATFYKAFSLKPRGKHQISVCLGTACHVRGAEAVLRRIERELGIRHGESTEDMEYALQTVNCLGACALGPVVTIDGQYHGGMTSAKVAELLRKHRAGKVGK
jgi:NADH-quinone oxidoreductase subunit E